MNRRVRIIRHWLSGRSNGVSAADLLHFAVQPGCARKARPQILSVEPDGELLRIRLAGVATPLFWPAGVDLQSLFMVLVESRDPRDWHYYEVPETRVEEDDFVVDCGAAEGLFALLAAARARHVYAIEPSPEWIPALRRTFESAGNVTILPYALGSAPSRGTLASGTLDAHVTDGTVEDGTGSTVTIETLDRLFIDRGRPMTYLKADVEGHECELLRGAHRTLQHNRPKIAITTYHVRDHAEQIGRLLREIEPRYRVRVKGIDGTTGSPVMLHAWIPG